MIGQVRFVVCCLGVLTGCLGPNPDFDGPASGASAASGTGESTDSADGSGGETGTSNGEGETSDTNTDTDSTGGPQVVAFPATLAVCIDATALDPDACATHAGAGNFEADLHDAILDAEIRAFLRFDPDDSFANATILDVVLEFTVADGDPSAISATGGEIWRVEAFTLPDLSNGFPQTVGGRLAGDAGMVDLNTKARWTLPTDSVVASTALFLGLWPTSDDGVKYEDAAQPTPPTLYVTYE
jgi:hypothetical protein